MSNFGKRKMICKYGHDIAIVGRNRSGVCNECYRADSRKPIKREQKRKYGWKVDGIINEFGDSFSHNDFNRLFQIQGGMCAMCGVHQKELPRALCVDHDRKTGKARGLLCMRCNRNMVGSHTLETAKKLIDYLQKAQNRDSTDTEIESNECNDATATCALAGNDGTSTEVNSSKVGIIQWQPLKQSQVPLMGTLRTSSGRRSINRVKSGNILKDNSEVSARATSCDTVESRAWNCAAEDNSPKNTRRESEDVLRTSEKSEEV
jgi:hypothetical protein